MIPTNFTAMIHDSLPPPILVCPWRGINSDPSGRDHLYSLGITYFEYVNDRDAQACLPDYKDDSYPHFHIVEKNPVELHHGIMFLRQWA